MHILGGQSFVGLRLAPPKDVFGHHDGAVGDDEATAAAADELAKKAPARPNRCGNYERMWRGDPPHPTNVETAETKTPVS